MPGSLRECLSYLAPTNSQALARDPVLARDISSCPRSSSPAPARDPALARDPARARDQLLPDMLIEVVCVRRRWWSPRGAIPGPNCVVVSSKRANHTINSSLQNLVL